jgi:hypothetical protein
MRRLTADSYREVATSGLLGEVFVVESDEVSKDWDLLHHILSNGQQDLQLPVAQAILGGQLLEAEPDDYNGYRVHAPSIQYAFEILRAFDAEAARTDDAVATWME